jgi:hypothetical protein
LIYEYNNHVALPEQYRGGICFFRGSHDGGFGGSGAGNPPRDDDDDFCGRRFGQEQKLCARNYGQVWGFDSFAYQGCIERAKIRQDMCRRGLKPPPRWSDRDVSGEPPIPNRRKMSWLLCFGVKKNAKLMNTKLKMKCHYHSTVD